MDDLDAIGFPAQIDALSAAIEAADGIVIAAPGIQSLGARWLEECVGLDIPPSPINH